MCEMVQVYKMTLQSVYRWKFWLYVSKLMSMCAHTCWVCVSKCLTELRPSRYMHVYTLWSPHSVFPPASPLFSPPSLSLSLPLLSPPHHWWLGSPVREPSVWTGQRVYCTSWAVRRTHRRTQTSQPYWPAHIGLPQSVWLTLVTSQPATGVKSVCVTVCVWVGRGISVAVKVKACSSSHCLWSCLWQL